jgi:hypothetical protein
LIPKCDRPGEEWVFVAVFWCLMFSETTNGFIFKKFHELHYISNFKIIYGVFLGLNLLLGE